MTLDQTESFQFEKFITVSAPINIALVKYWGKEDEDKIIPKNNSISLTLNKNQLQSTTRVRVSTFIESHEFIINNKKSSVTKRMIKMFDNALKKSAIPIFCHEKLKFEITTRNNFPIAAGMASSASGMAALAFGFGEIFSFSIDDVSILARLGSGSATRSVYGGIVEWIRGSGDDSRAVQLYDENYWPDLQVLILVVNGSEKKVPSTAGMQTTVETSQLSRYRYSHVAEENLAGIREALRIKSFPKLAEITMRESNQLHAICLDTIPPLVYLNPASFDIIEFVNAVNEACKMHKLAYTFDAGPNAFLIFEKTFQSTLYRLLHYSFDIDLTHGTLNSCLKAEGDNDGDGVSFQVSYRFIVEISIIDMAIVQKFHENLSKRPGIIKCCIPTNVIKNCVSCDFIIPAHLYLDWFRASSPPRSNCHIDQ